MQVLNLSGGSSDDLDSVDITRISWQDDIVNTTVHKVVDKLVNISLRQEAGGGVMQQVRGAIVSNILGLSKEVATVLPSGENVGVARVTINYLKIVRILFASLWPARL